MKEKILSVGIDIGTSTTVVLFSHIIVENISDSFRMPDAKIVDKEVIYRSPIHSTPLLSQTELDVEAITAIVRDEYKRAGISKDAVQTGAVIITGDTARKSNAENVLHSVSAYAGDFVVASAGPELESILAGKGSGAEQYSRDHIESITNLDVGGGTTNSAQFYDGVVVNVDCLDIGGRLLRFRPGTLEIASLFPNIGELARDLGFSLSLGMTATVEQVAALAAAMAEIVLEPFVVDHISPWYRRARTVTREERHWRKPDVISFSGGVGDLIYLEDSPDDFAYDDIGVFLAREIKRYCEAANLKIVKPSETIGATVVGAGIHSITISGSTILVTHPEVLPVKNIPILKISDSERLSPAEFKNAIENNVQWIQGYNPTQPVALAVDCGRVMTFGDITTLADKILLGMESFLQAQEFLLVVMLSDFGKVLGQTLKARMPEGKGILCLDGVNVRNGDYIDIGRPIGVGDALPVVIKTLAFSY